MHGLSAACCNSVMQCAAAVHGAADFYVVEVILQTKDLSTYGIVQLTCARSVYCCVHWALYLPGWLPVSVG